MIYQPLPYNVQKTFEKLVKKHDFDKLSELVEKERGKIANRYLKGFYSEELYNKHMDGVTIFPSFELLRDMGLCHTASYPAWLRLQSDWMLWKEGKSPVSLVGTPWLVNEHGKEVSQDEKVMFFTLLEIFKTPIDTFEYCPSTITQPQLTIDHTYASGLDIAVRLDAISDSGLISDADPFGKSYSIFGENKIIAHVTINGISRSGSSASPSFEGVGYIEGYTSEVERPIIVHAPSKASKTYLLTFYSDNIFHDLSVFYHDPRWQQYFKWQYERDDRITKELLKINHSYNTMEIQQ